MSTLSPPTKVDCSFLLPLALALQKLVVPDTESSINFATFHRGVGSQYEEFKRDSSGKLTAPKGIAERVEMWRKHPHTFAWPRVR